eukprot:TRINITY_DN26571_c0_g1_i1.p1 TRINITY_DN26571_c0_g1~~TRINITY_DN26571_c0_g1_i1.p1  ORF type:complete len:370 (-),score=71.89 TRINITY_DN26571_c0_g1_i1:37-1095(-)
MDFDDLDEAEGEVASSMDPPKKEVKASGYEPFEYMPPIPRNYRLPDFNSVPEKLRKTAGMEGLESYVRPKVCIRAFVFYGAGDTWYTWAQMAKDAPAYIEMAVHEWPSHGSRDEEEHPLTLEKMANDAFRAVKPALEQHAKGGRIAKAPFVFISHSIGCLIAMAVAKKAREELGLEPAGVVMMDRAAPNIPLHSEAGQKRRDEDPWAFMKEYNGMVYNAASGAGGEKGERMIKMWVDDVKIGSDTRPVGFHKFNCELLLLVASENAGIEALKDSPKKEDREYHATRDKLMGSPPGWAMDCSPEQYEQWKGWVAEGLFEQKSIKADHVRIKSHPEALAAIWELCDRLKAPDPS